MTSNECSSDHISSSIQYNAEYNAIASCPVGGFGNSSTSHTVNVASIYTGKKTVWVKI
jgi:hypothetical protein